jgi:hypothetical protein
MRDQLTVFFTASHRGEKKYKSAFNLVYETVKSFPELTVVSPGWNENFSSLLEEEGVSILDERLKMYEAMRKGIQKADAVIIETSQESFQLGHETTLALLGKKPVLCLSLHEDFQKRIHHDYFFGAQYTEQNLHGIIQDFLSKVRDLSLSKRFNLFLYPQQVEHVQKEAQKNNMNMSEYLRYLINLDRNK